MKTKNIIDGCFHVQFIGCEKIPLLALRSIFRCVKKKRDLAECGFNVISTWNEELKCFQVRMPKKVGRGDLEDYRLTTTIRLRAGSEEHLLPAIQEGMDLDEEGGEGLLHYDVQKVS
tara:strand:- start:1391 stop:1741 length:351 start_codon:yes stop_codon:yes gene_type:complete